MEKIFVMYYSENGTTKKYAEWIAEEVKGDLYEIKNAKPDMLSGYEYYLKIIGRISSFQ